MIESLPLFHRIADAPVIVLGNGDAAEAKRRLVARAGGRICTELAEGIAAGARLAFLAFEADGGEVAERLAAEARAAGLLVNVTDRPALCDFTVPSILDRAPLLLAIGTGGASAGLAKAVRLRLETLLPQGLGRLARALGEARPLLRQRFPDAGERRRALDMALGEGGALDLLREHPEGAVPRWLEGASGGASGVVEIALRSADPEDLTLREARLLGSVDLLLHEPGVPPRSSTGPAPTRCARCCPMARRCRRCGRARALWWYCGRLDLRGGTAFGAGPRGARSWPRGARQAFRLILAMPAPHLLRHSRAGGNPVLPSRPQPTLPCHADWIPACAGMTRVRFLRLGEMI
ncbi:bifunctional precorrin-2 dehydrogenase/sirohydrochlorin ferrochelatase [Novosphingobium sp. 9]|uniref:precorrin-2 dehydrogenase/sirohydrochlorin ferrochelatase family protein n=1 Tax=Novosphingobium sp. 9 TaxID=2025349 RepID=UPI0028CB5343|nr:bifunctional precorrin-2 dehydrogenase/sirohydrochlorin ferrochelatase [Novosphingobium sp. 9]